MLDMAKALANCDEKFFGGWVLAGLNVSVRGKALRHSNKVALSKQHKAIIDVEGTTLFGTVINKLRVFLILPQENAQLQITEEEPQGSILFAHAFSEQEIAAYVAYTGDENIIHKGKSPVVPGLCMARWLQERLELERLDWRISFLAPVRADELVSFYLSAEQIRAYIGKRLVFTVDIN